MRKVARHVGNSVRQEDAHYAIEATVYKTVIRPVSM